MQRLAVAFGLILIASGFCLAQEAKANVGDDTPAVGAPCSTSDGVRIEHCILRDKSGKPLIAPEHLSELAFDSYGLATLRAVSDLQLNWMYVNRKGEVVVSGVPHYDNGADRYSEGLVRTVIEGKYGFANRTGRIVIQPKWDFAFPFDNGHAEACNGCWEECADRPNPGRDLKNCTGHRIMVGGEWFTINKKGVAVKKKQR